MEFEKLKKIIVEVLNVDENEITMDTTFIDDLGADSLDVFQIIMGLEEEFDNFIQNIRQLAVQYEDGVASYGDELLTLSTCNNYTEDGRLFVVAKKCTDDRS